MSMAVESTPPLTKRQRLEFEIFDKSIAEIQCLFTTGGLDSTHFKCQRTDHKVSSLFDRPKRHTPRRVTDASAEALHHNITTATATAQHNSNYTYKPSLSYTSLFSNEHHKSKTRETSVEKSEAGDDTSTPREPTANTKMITEKDTKLLINSTHIANHIQRREREPVFKKENKLTSRKSDPRHQLLTTSAQHQLYAASVELYHKNKNWSLWRSEVMGMIDFYANDDYEDMVEMKSAEGFEETIRDILLKR